MLPRAYSCFVRVFSLRFNLITTSSSPRYCLFFQNFRCEYGDITTTAPRILNLFSSLRLEVFTGSTMWLITPVALITLAA